MSDSLLNTSIANLRTELLAAIPSATAAELMNIARSAKGLGLGQDSAIETAVNSRANTLTNTATAADIIKISGAVKQMLQPPSSGGGGSATDLTAVSTNIIPDTDITYDLGSPTFKFKDLYLDGNTLNLGTQTIKATATGIEVPELKIGTGTNSVKLTAGADGKLTTTETDSSGNTSSPAASGGGSSVTVSDTAPTSPSAGDQWFDSSSLTMFVYYADGSSSQWVPATPAGQTGATGSTGAGGSSVTSYANLAAFPSSGNTNGDIGFATDTKSSYMWDGVAWQRMSMGPQIGPRYTTTPPATHALNTDGTTTTLTAVAVDESGFPITYDWDAYNGATVYSESSLPPQLTGVSESSGVFTLTPSTNTANVGNFSFRVKASDGVLSTPAISTVSLTFYTFVKPTVYTSAGNGSTMGASIVSQTATSITFNMNTFAGSYLDQRGNMAGLELPYGKYYFEAVTTNSIDDDMFTLTKYDWSTTPTPSNGTADSYGWIYNTDATAYQYYYTNDISTTSSSGGAYNAFFSLSAHANAESRMGIAYDSATNNWWMRLGQSGWMWGDPVAGTGGYNGSTAGVSNGTSHKFFLGSGNGGSSYHNYSFRVESQSLHQYSTPTGFTTL